MARRIAHKLESQWRSDDVLHTDENATFEQFVLSDRVLSGLRKSGFVRPSPIQLKAIPLGLCGFDMVVQAKSGTGKTCVFSTLALQVVDVSTNAVQVLILAPTREIAVQSCDTVCCLGCDTPGLRTYAFIGGVPLCEDLRKLSRCHVAVGTLGRLLQLVKQGELSLKSVHLVVLDEADQLLNEGFQGDLRELWARLPLKRQVVATSATYPPEVARTLEEELLQQPSIVRLGAKMPSLLGVTQWYCVAKGTEEAAWFSRKARTLITILRRLPFSQCLVFLNSQARAQSLVERLFHAGFRAQLLSGAQEQRDRLKALVCLKAFRCRVLVSTDLGARGIDAEHVNLVINFDVARNLETHLHRSGRAGRYGTAGQTVSLVTGRAELDQLLQLCLPLQLDIRPLPGFPSLEPGDSETEVKEGTHEDDSGDCTVNGDVAGASSSDFGVNDIVDEDDSDDCKIRDDGSEIDPEKKLEGKVLSSVNDAAVSVAKDELLLEKTAPFQLLTELSPTLDVIVQCQQPEPIEVLPTLNRKAWCDLTWPPEPSVGIELAAGLKAAKEAFYTPFEGSLPPEQILDAAVALEDQLSLCSSYTEAEALDAHVRPDDIVPELHAIAAAHKLSCTSQQKRELSSVALNSEAAGTEEAGAGVGKSFVSHNLHHEPTGVTLELEGLSTTKALKDVSFVPDLKAAACEMLHPMQLEQEASPVASNSNATGAEGAGVASEESFVSCSSHQELSGAPLDSEEVSTAQAQKDDVNFALDLKAAASQVPCASQHQQEASSVALNSDVARAEVARKGSSVGPKSCEELTSISSKSKACSLSDAQKDVCVLDVKAVEHNLPCSSLQRQKPETKSELAGTKDADLSREGSSLSHNSCQEANGSRLESNRLNSTKVREKRSTQGSVRKRKDIATWIMERSNLAGVKKDKDVVAGCSQLSSASSKPKQRGSECVNEAKGKEIRTPQKKPIPATTTVRGNSSEQVWSIPGATHREPRQRKSDSESEESDVEQCGRLPVQLERRKRPSYRQSSQTRCSGRTYLAPPTTAVMSSLSPKTNPGPASRTGMCDQCTLKCDAIRAACCMAQRSSQRAAVSSSSFPYSWTQRQAPASNWSQNWLHWYQCYIRGMLEVNSHQ